MIVRDRDNINPSDPEHSDIVIAAGGTYTNTIVFVVIVVVIVVVVIVVRILIR